MDSFPYGRSGSNGWLRRLLSGRRRSHTNGDRKSDVRVLPWLEPPPNEPGHRTPEPVPVPEAPASGGNGSGPLPETLRWRLPDAPPPEGAESSEELEGPDLPKFKFASPTLPRARHPGRDRHAAREAERLWDVFTPSRPQSADHLFVGRRPTIERIIRAIQEEHAHVVVYGGRGIGKTSVGNVVADSARRAGYHIARCTCDSETSFERLFQEFLKNLPHDLMDRSAPANGLSIRTVDELLDAGRLAPTDLSNIFHDLIEPIIFIIDEFDRVRDATFRRKMSEAIKVISDSTDLLTVVIMGVGQTLHELFGHHMSIQRHIRAIRLPLMENHEIRKLLRQGEAKANITFDEAVLESVTALSRGTPYYAHLLGLLSGRHALVRESTAVGPKDLSAAISDLLMEIDPNVVAAYERTTQEEANFFMTDVLYAASAAPFDAYGSFSVADVCEELASCTGKPYQTLVVACALSRLSKDKQGGILEKWTTPGGAIMYEFVNPLMRQYILLRQFERRGGTKPYTFPDMAPPPDGHGKVEPLQRHRSWS